MSTRAGADVQPRNARTQNCDEPMSGTLLEASSRVRWLLLLVALAGCPSTQEAPGDDVRTPDGGGGGDGGPVDGGADGPTAPVCEQPVPRCSVTIRYTGPGAAVSLRGDFAADGWTRGVDMPRVGDAFEATVDAADQQVVVYKLVVDGAWIADPGNPRTSPDGYGGMNSVVRVDCDHCPPRPAIDWRDAVLYFVLLDRFKNGDPSNDAPVADVETPGQYQGGDLAGVRQAIEDGYFARLGVDALWITSPIDNADGRNPGSDGHAYSGYHGYWPSQVDRTDEHVGTEAELRALVDVAHAHGLQVLIDYVMNHVHADSPIYQTHRDWFWPNDNGAGGDCVCGHGCEWNSQRLRCWFDPFLPDFDFRNGDARRFSVDNAIAWARRTGIDGFRLDAVKHIETAWLTDLRARIRGELEWDQHFYLVGETFEGDRNLIKAYVDPDTMLDGQFDFPLRAQLLRIVLGRRDSMRDLVGFLDGNDGFYGPGAVMSTFVGNHDVPRVIHLAEDTPLFGEWDGGKQRAWTDRPALPSTARPFERVAVAYTLLMTVPGIPLLYYGDEIGMAGAGDPDNRHFMQWDGLSAHQVWLRDRLTALIAARHRHPALRRGQRRSLGTGDDVAVYEMSAPGDRVLVALNRGDAAAPATGLTPGDYVDEVTGEPWRAPLSIPPRTGLVLVPR